MKTKRNPVAKVLLCPISPFRIKIKKSKKKYSRKNKHKEKV